MRIHFCVPLRDTQEQPNGIAISLCSTFLSGSCGIVRHQNEYYVFDTPGVLDELKIQGGPGCRLRVFAVGGGGGGDGHCGGGSGFTEFKTSFNISDDNSTYTLQVTVGDNGHASTATLDGDETQIFARHGYNGDSTGRFGGDGYSGGILGFFRLIRQKLYYSL